MAVRFYQRLTRAIESKEPCDAIKTFIFEYAEFQVLFVSDIEQQQTTESLNRTILMFDYIFYLMAEKYGELLCRER